MILDFSWSLQLGMDFNLYSHCRLWQFLTRQISTQVLFQSTQPSQAVTEITESEISKLEDFNPHSPRRLWHVSRYSNARSEKFQSTQPSQAVTKSAPLLIIFDGISIHTALAGCDSWEPLSHQSLSRFQSTQPSQAVTHHYSPTWAVWIISIHTALAGCDVYLQSSSGRVRNFNPHSPRRLWLQ